MITPTGSPPSSMKMYVYSEELPLRETNTHQLADPTHGNVDYVSLADAQKLGLTKVIGNQVFMGVDNTTVLKDTVNGKRKSIWVESVDEFTHGVLIGDFAHMPGSDCGSWPAL
jgi:hypothetical protein